MLASVTGVRDAVHWTAAAEIGWVENQGCAWRVGSARSRSAGCAGGGSSRRTNLQVPIAAGDWGVDRRGTRQSCTTLRTSFGGTKLGGWCNYGVWTWLRILNIGTFHRRTAIADCA